MSVLSARNLAKSYAARQVVKDVSLDVVSGEVIGLLGPNGAGKTTSFYMIMGLVPTEHGKIYIDGSEITRFPMDVRARLGLGYLPQEASIFRKLTVKENLLAVIETLDGLSASEQDRRLNNLMAEFQISHLKDHPATSLSGGERRRTEIARALAREPRFILLDEPFAGVDPISVLDIQRIVKRLSELGIGILITDHNVRETLGICNRAYIVNDGAIIAHGPPEAILSNEQVRQVYLGWDFRL